MSLGVCNYMDILSFFLAIPVPLLIYDHMQRYEEWMRVRADELKAEVYKLYLTCNNVIEKITLVDVVQHLGINHLFEEQTNNALREISKSEFSSSNIHEVSLRFRLLRAHGYWVSPGIFPCTNIINRLSWSKVDA